MATTYPSHPTHKDPAPAPKAEPTADTPTPREGTEPEADRVPFHGGGFAKVGGAYPGGYVQPEEPPPPPEEDARSAKAAKK